MANVLSLNTADHPTLTQLLVNTPAGLFDFLAQKSGASVTLTGSSSDNAKKEAVKRLINASTGKAWVTES